MQITCTNDVISVSSSEIDGALLGSALPVEAVDLYEDDDVSEVDEGLDLPIHQPIVEHQGATENGEEKPKPGPTRKPNAPPIR